MVKYATVFYLVFMAVIFVWALSIPLGAWDDPIRSAKALTAAGFSDTKLGEDHVIFACGNSDVSALAFEATNPRGEPVSGVVCCGWWKNCTIRF